MAALGPRYGPEVGICGWNSGSLLYTVQRIWELSLRFYASAGELCGVKLPQCLTEAETDLPTSRALMAEQTTRIINDLH